MPKEDKIGDHGASRYNGGNLDLDGELGEGRRRLDGYIERRWRA